jgi:hypothetical protein
VDILARKSPAWQKRVECPKLSRHTHSEGVKSVKEMKGVEKDAKVKGRTE